MGGTPADTGIFETGGGASKSSRTSGGEERQTSVRKFQRAYPGLFVTSYSGTNQGHAPLCFKTAGPSLVTRTGEKQPDRGNAKKSSGQRKI